MKVFAIATTLFVYAGIGVWSVTCCNAFSFPPIVGTINRVSRTRRVSTTKSKVAVGSKRRYEANDSYLSPLSISSGSGCSSSSSATINTSTRLYSQPQAESSSAARNDRNSGRGGRGGRGRGQGRGQGRGRGRGRSDGRGRGRGRENSSSNRIEQANQEYKQKRLNDRLERQLAKFEKDMEESEDNGNGPTQFQYDNLLAISAACNDWDTYEMVQNCMDDESSEEEVEAEGLTMTQDTYRIILRECHSAANGVAALRVLDEMIVPSSVSSIRPQEEDYKLAILALCRNSKYEKALWKKALQLIYVSAAAVDRGDLNKTLDIIAYNAVLQCMEQDRRYEDALDLLDLMEEGEQISYHTLPNLATYHHVLDTLIASNQNSEAVEILLSLPGRNGINVAPTIYSYEIVMSALLRKKGREDWRRAVQLLDSMYELRITPPTVMFNRVIAACGKAKQLRAAEDVFRKMRSRKISPDTVTFNSLISICASTGRAKDALRLFDLCKKEAAVDIITYTNTIRACAKAKMSRRAIQLLEDAKKNNMPLDAFIFTAVIDACAKSRMWRDALKVLEDMKKNNVLANEYSYSAAITACGNCGQWERALELMDQMKERDMRISTIVYNAAIGAIAKGARRNVNHSLGIDISTDKQELWTKAVELIDEMKSNRVWPDIYTYSSVISACAAGGRYEETLELIKEMRSGSPRVRPNKIAYTGAIAACARSGEYSHALQLFVNMQADGIQGDIVAYNALVSAFANSGQSELAFDIWNDLCGKGKGRFNAGASTGVSPDIITLTSVVASLERAEGEEENLEKIDQVFAEAVERQIVLRSDSIDTAWEIDLSGMSFPIARAACRFILDRLKNNAKNAEEYEDLSFITGTGERYHPETSPGQQITEEDEKHSGATTLRQYVGDILEQDFDPPLVSSTSGGVVEIKKKTIEKWIESQ